MKENTRHGFGRLIHLGGEDGRWISTRPPKVGSKKWLHGIPRPKTREPGFRGSLKKPGRCVCSPKDRNLPRVDLGQALQSRLTEHGLG
jgi:hypothetical protein